MSLQDSLAWQLTQLSAEAQRPLLLIVNHNRELDRLHQLVKFFNPSLPILSFPDWETLPYEHLSPAPTQIHQRLETLYQLAHCKEGIVAVTTTSLLQRLPPRTYIDAYVFQFSSQDTIDITKLSQRLAAAGYQRVTTLTLPGEFTVRGEIIEIYPLAARLPFRIHTAFNIIENLYYFDIETSAPRESIQTIRIMPTREFALTLESIQHFQNQGSQLLKEPFLNSTINQQLSTTTHVAGIEYYLPLFFEKTQSFLDYLPKHTHWITEFNLVEKLQEQWNWISERHHQLRHDSAWPILSPEKLYRLPSDVMSQLRLFKETTVKKHVVTVLPNFHEVQLDKPLHKLSHFLSTSHQSWKVLFSTTRFSEREKILDKLQAIEVSPNPTDNWDSFLKDTAPHQISVTPIKNGFCVPSAAWLIIPDTALYESTYTIAPKKELNASSDKLEESFNNLSQLTINDLIVHIEHGIGRYLGLETVVVNKEAQEFIMLAYADNTKLYVPVQNIQLIKRYASQGEAALDHLNSHQWKKTKQKALTQLKDTAAELLVLYAQRAQAKGERFQAPNADYAAFKAAFGFEETREQTHAIADVIKDLCSDKPMDRLVCGDVGFGKTEVAMRAAFLAIQSGKQVVILAPTTLLVDQHYRNFKERFASWPVTIDWVSRFRRANSLQAAKQKIAEGTTDIVIGTHALLSKQFTFKELGLVVIDEEHHFGVQQKEKLVQLKSEVNILTLTATPIPRTLQTTLSGLRDLSLITTPPKGRLSIKNFISQREKTTIREAVLRELSRGGQVYFVHNRIASLERVRAEIQALVPEAKIGVAHGQLSEHELEACMQAFYQQRYNLLLCTSIIETGLDVPTVNTLIVDRADHFGLAQLHQLRGRIGRSHHQAYAYFLLADETSLTQNSYKRLQALSTLNELGSGFNLASQDLDIRGAGELLGDKQSGTIQGLGFSLYLELLEKTIQKTQSQETVVSLDALSQSTLINLRLPTFIPETYLPDISKRLYYYQRINKTADYAALSNIEWELFEAYGKLPQEVNYLLAVTNLKQQAERLGINTIEAHHKGGWLQFNEDHKIETDLILKLVQKESEQFKLTPNSQHTQPKLRFVWENYTQPNQRLEGVRAILEKLK